MSNTSTTITLIKYVIKTNSNLSIDIADQLGRKIATTLNDEYTSNFPDNAYIIYQPIFPEHDIRSTIRTLASQLITDYLDLLGLKSTQSFCYNATKVYTTYDTNHLLTSIRVIFDEFELPDADLTYTFSIIPPHIDTSIQNISW